MDGIFTEISLSALTQFFFVIMLMLIPSVLWAVWDLERRRCDWLLRRQAKNGRRQSSKFEATTLS
jgi:hypothetical protein